MGVAETLTIHGHELTAAERERMLAAIGRQTRLLDNITADLLAAGQAQHGTLAVQLEQVDPADIVRSVVDDTFDLTLVNDHRPLVVTDPMRLQQMLGNLLSNARKYGEPPFEVRVTPAGSHVSIAVEDSGPGVPEAFRPRLFQEYSRAPGQPRPGHRARPVRGPGARRGPGRQRHIRPTRPTRLSVHTHASRCASTLSGHFV